MANFFTFDCNGRPAQVEVVGSGPDVVMVGAAVPMLWSRGASTELAQLGFRVTNFDYGSGWDDPEPRSALTQTADVLRVMASLDIGRASLVGLSRGAMTAYWQAVCRPDTVEDLVLLFPVAGFADVLLEAETEEENSPTNVDELLESLFSPPFLIEHRDRAYELVSTPPGSVARVDRADEDPFPVHSNVSCRTLVIEGDQDIVVSAHHPARYLAAVPGSEHVVVTGACHGWPMEEPVEFARIVSEFLVAGG